jgi:hypothetical protein
MMDHIQIQEGTEHGEKERDFKEGKVRYSDIDEVCQYLLSRESQWR